jgi:hypothetical protein
MLDAAAALAAEAESLRTSCEAYPRGAGSDWACGDCRGRRCGARDDYNRFVLLAKRLIEQAGAE